MAEYIVHRPTDKFSRMRVVPASQREHEGSSSTFRKKLIDLSVPRQIAPYDKLGCRSLIASVKYAIFRDKSIRMTRERCERFFDDAGNFAV